MKNIYKCISVLNVSKAIAIAIFAILPYRLLAQQAPSIQTGVNFQWSDTQASSSDPATIESVTINGVEYNTFVVPTSYELTRLGPDGDTPNRILLNGSNVGGNSSSPNWNTNAINAFQDKNLNHYFTAIPNGRDICLDFDATETTDAQKQTIFYSPAIPANQDGVLAVTERGGNNCFYLEIWGTPPNGGPEQKLGGTFVRNNGNYTGCTFGVPNTGSDYWRSGRCNDNGQTIGIGLFYLNDIAPTGSRITKIEFVGATQDHGDGKFFLLQKYAVDQQSINCIDESYNGSVDLANNVPENSTYTLISGPNPVGESFTFNSDGTYNYVSTPGFVGDVTFEYEVCLPEPNTSVCDSATATISFAEEPPITQTIIASCGSADNTFTISVVSPIGTEYEYSLNGGLYQSSTDFTNLSEGSYIISTRSTLSSCVTINPDAIVLEYLELTASIDDVLCNSENNGAIDINVSGGTPPYSFQWNTSDTTEDLSNLSGGIYTVTVTDANGCSISDSFTVNQPAEELTSTISAVDVLCNGDDNGSIDFTVTGGTPPYNYSWNTGETTEDLTNLPIGSYSVTATDTNGCSTTQQISVEQPNQALSATIININNVDCSTGFTGDVLVEAQGGTAPYTYSIDAGSTNQPNGFFDNLPEGNYNILITDTNGCTFSLDALITTDDVENPEISVPSLLTIEGCAASDINTLNAVFPYSEVQSGDVQNIFLSNTDYNASDDFNILSITYIDVVTLTNDCPITVSRTFTITDNCNNSATAIQTITIQDITPPTLNVPADITIECAEDQSSANTGTATGSDTCGSVAITQSDIETAGPCGGTKTIVRTWTATDLCGNMTSADQVISVVDNRPPILTLPADVTIECNEDSSSASTGLAKGEDDCGGVRISESDVVTEDCGNTRTILRTWTVTDNCGNPTSGVQTITVVDTTPPTLSIPADIIIECTEDESNTNTGVATGSDTCGSVSISQSDAETSACGNTKTIIRTWTATDECGNTTSADQTITVRDTTPPTIDDSAIENINIECSITSNPTLDAWLNNNAGATASDTCGNISWSNDFDPTLDVDCTDGAITVTFIVTDECGNTASTTATYSIIDEVPPTLTLPADTTIECGEDTLPINTGEASATDECSDTSITYADTEVSACGNTRTIIRTWTATDACGNSTSADQTITVQDTIPPTFTVPADITIECDVDVTDVTITGDVTDEADNCATNLEAIFSDSIADGTCPITSIITRTWSLTDDCNNTATFVQTITVQDTTPPTFSVPEDITIECNVDATDLSLTGDVTDEEDNCSTNLEAVFTDSVVDGGCTNASIITRTWSLTDDCNNTTTFVQTITVQDTTPPTFSVPEDITIECDVDATDLSLTGEVTDENDNCSANLEAIFSDSIIDGSCPNSSVIARTWSLTDDCNNNTTFVQTITIQDTTPPTISIPSDIIIECTEDESSLNTGEATGIDNCGSVTISQSDVETSACGNTKTIIRTWTATDECGNASSANQTITVRDTTAPTIDDSASENIIIECGITPDGTLEAWLTTNAGATANDSCGNVSWSNDFDVSADGDCTNGAITVTFTATDDCGNTASTSATYSIIDEVAPTLTLPVDVTIECGEDILPFNTGQANANDDCSTPSITYSDIEVLACGNTKTITRTWTAEDSCGNTTSADQIITVEDTTPPTFNEALPVDISVECNNVPTPETLTVNDNCGTATIAFNEAITTGSCLGNYTIERTWLATDSCGNETTHTQLITVEDNTAPTIVTPFEENITVACEGIPDRPDLVFEDSCSNNISVAYSEVSTQTNDFEDYEIIRTWIVTDDCDNVAEFTQTINVEFNNVITTIDSNLCILDTEIDLFDLLSGDFNMNGTWSVVSGNAEINGSLFDPSSVDVGVYTFMYSITDDPCTAGVEVTITINDDCVVLGCGQDDVIISKTVTANGDSFNEFFTITGVEDCDFVIELQIFNRWGAEIYKSSNYQNDWNGEAHRSSVGGSGKVPTGTYYYIINIKDSGLSPFSGPIYVATN